METIEIEKLKDYAGKLMFDMKEEEYQTLQEEFKVILKQMDYIEKIEGIQDVKPMTFPFITYQAKLRKDEVKNTLTVEEALKNAKKTEKDQVRVPKVVE